MDDRMLIADMQASVFRKAQKKWKLTGSECADVFEKYKLFEFIRDCYDSLHTASYDCALRDVEVILEKNGVKFE